MTRYKKQDPEITRRRFVNAAMGGAAAVGTLGLVSALGGAKPVLRITPDKAPPRKGDILVHAGAGKEGQPILVSEVGEKAVSAWPMGKDKDGNMVIRKAEPNNQMAVFRFDKDKFKVPEEGGHSPVVLKLEGITDNGIVAYSNKCTHAGCPPPNDPKDITKLFCGCHSGQYDLLQGCKVIGGPPPRSMPQVPIKIENNQLVVTETFVTAPFGFLNEADWEAYLKRVEEVLG
ncbi:ubiquinol-cytochrome c reductase iron-sulfur subunit [Deinococcus multiflagellatus]|uniref:Ubiquinol-cytochrome c reductase iron-sulfur subunit n=1 Tax=Deinococcus multiflagellatus TaxID=1656887 RepID=A0ABW1ZL38_9DEIO|nr:Rieske (2Fe-2S) protein [Deinococcus multiflagellatus]MBZ9713969.1 Rieske 2Fe-2S domain-containing protein [Deinococcus multiflagellatus]